jgi:exodeoxyribonuclease-3
MKRIVTYNVNGIRAAMNKGFDNWLQTVNADIICLQEIKANEEQVDVSVFVNQGFHCYWFSAQKKGYSGVAIFSKEKPMDVHAGCDNPLYDGEGRMLRLDFENFSVISVYHPSGTTGDERQNFKMQWLDYFQYYINNLRIKIPNLVISGDYNICNKAIDIHNPVSNKNSSGFLPEEREWFDKFLESGYVDTFRHLNKEPDHYTWWSYRANAREKNLGWRIDYNLVTNTLMNKIKAVQILPEAMHSDHCPCLVELDI